MSQLKSGSGLPFSYLGENVSFRNFYATYFEIKIYVLRMKIQIFNHIFTNCVISQKWRMRNLELCQSGSERTIFIAKNT